MATDDTLAEVEQRFLKYDPDPDTAFDRFKNDEFIRMDAGGRLLTLRAWDEMLEKEVRPTKEHASWITRKRELDDLHFLLVKACR